MMRQYHIPLPQREALTANDFMITDSNSEAVTWLFERDAKEWPNHCLIVYGPKGSGKTHMLSIWQTRYQARSIELGAPVIDQIIGNSSAYPAISVDNADQAAGKAELEEWLQHLYVVTSTAKIPVLLAAATPPSAWNLKLKDIDSRLKSCPAIALKEPDDALMRAMLMKQFSDRQLLVENGVIEYLARRLERTGDTIRQTVQLLDEKALEQGHKLSIPFVQDVLGHRVQ